jgi:hypothetical protein
MSKQEKGKNKETLTNQISTKNIVEREQFDKDGNLVCPTCKKSLRGLITNVSDALVLPDKHTTKRRKVQCCSEACTAEFYDVQQKSLDE